MTTRSGFTRWISSRIGRVDLCGVEDGLYLRLLFSAFLHRLGELPDREALERPTVRSGDRLHLARVSVRATYNPLSPCSWPRSRNCTASVVLPAPGFP